MIDSARDRTVRGRLSSRPAVVLTVLAALLLAAVTMLFERTLGYDASGWVVYARELFGEGALNTNSFPAWKPLPILLTGPFTLITRGHLDAYWWLFLVRVCGILTVCWAALAARRLAGGWAALSAAVLIMLAPWWLDFTMTGEDALPTALLTLSALLALQRGHWRLTLLALTGCSLMRPEGAVLLAGFCVWARLARRLSTAEVIVALALVAGLWLVPDILHSGKSSAAVSSEGGMPGTPITTSDPVLATLTGAVSQFGIVPSLMVGLAAVSTVWGLTAAGRGSRLAQLWGTTGVERAALIFGLGWVLIVAAETLHGFSGNPRYLVGGLAVLTVVAAVTAVRGARELSRSFDARVALALTLAVLLVPVAIVSISRTRTTVEALQAQVTGANQMQHAVDTLRCAGPLQAGLHRDAYLARMTGQSIPESIASAPAAGDDSWRVYCSTAIPRHRRSGR